MRIFSIRDAKAEAYLQPFFSPNIATAIRALESAVQDPSHEFSKHAADYALFELGGFDELNGEITAQLPKVIIGLIELTKTANTEPSIAAVS